MLRKQTQFYFFSGKGGVGKTTASAASALHFARQGKKTLVVSIDPAHSLADSFGMKIGGEVAKLGKNLYGLEIDPESAVQEYKEKFAPKLEGGMLGSLGLAEGLDMAGMTPGMDEIAAFDRFLKFMGSDEYDVIIFDTAPTGHALRFLSLPDVLDSWVGKLIRIRMQFAGIAGIVGKLLPFGDKDGKEGKGGFDFGAKHLDEMKQRIKRAKEILTDPKRTHFSLVLIAEDMSILESVRSLETLNGFGIKVENVIVNNIVPENSRCDFCAARRRNQTEKLKTIRQKFGRQKVSQLPLLRDEVRGVKALEKVERLLYGRQAV
jgi:arsenite-transporting ATPase